MSAPRRCFYVDETMMTPNGLIPALVEEDDPGYWPMIGSGPHSQPWYWGHDMVTARAICDKANAELGVTPEQAHEIVASSIRAQHQQDRTKREAEARYELARRGENPWMDEDLEPYKRVLRDLERREEQR